MTDQHLTSSGPSPAAGEGPTAATNGPPAGHGRVLTRFVPLGPVLEEPVDFSYNWRTQEPDEPVHLVVSPMPGVSWERLHIGFETPTQCHLSLVLRRQTALLLYRELRARFVGEDRYGG